jgi:hypothetical protein
VGGTPAAASTDISEPYAKARFQALANVTQDVMSRTYPGLYPTVNLITRKIGDPTSLIMSAPGGRVATLTPGAFDALEKDERGFARVSLPWNMAVLLAAGTEVTITGATGAGVDRWEIPALSTTVTGAYYNNATYGGTAQVGQANNSFDYAITLSSMVPPVTGLGVTRGFQQLMPLVTGCPDPQFHSVDYATICWGDTRIVSGAPFVTGTPLITGFCAYQVERRDTLDTEWRRIAHITDQGILCFNDFEGRIGVASSYRVRVCRLDGVCGDWTTVTGFVRAGPSLSINAPAVTGTGCSGLIFTSNEDPSATLAYPYLFEAVLTPQEDFTFIEAETAVIQRLHMRDYQVVFKPLERGGVRFSRAMEVNTLAVPPQRLDRGFTSLRDLAWESLSYVAVLDTRGNRWFAVVLVPAASIREKRQQYIAQVEIIEVTDTPTVVDVAVV